ncbi:tetratricopeptide repeat protein [Candidatus Halobeggiatoa sp. HSG11]|nr:tetratricopeptide repeat protein [Candidatus Halobeggiatoa sp. HSG11]
MNQYLTELTKWYVQVLVLAILVALTYGHTLDVPFYLDDFSSIRENYIIYNWQGTLAELWNFSALRIIGYITFVLNYQVHQFQVFGYHIVNIIIHFSAGLAILVLLRGLVRTPTLSNVLSDEAKRWLPLVAALIFVLHPLQIQGVTYIVQRLASLAALFYLASMACFVQARLSSVNIFRFIWGIACILFILLAFFTKQNTVTLPIALLLIELIFFQSEQIRIRGLQILVGFGLAIFTFWLALDQSSAMQKFVFENLPFLQTVDSLTRETTSISRTAYLATQMSVLWIYISLFFWSDGSHIDYDNKILMAKSFFSDNENYHFAAKLMDSEPFFALIGHLLILGLAIYSVRRFALVSFAILFYYLAHIIESSILPIRDVIFEHRTYLPNLGLAILFAWLLVVQLPRWLKAKQVAIITVILLLFLSSSTWSRNQMWRTPVELWQHNVEQSPNKQRGWIILGKHLIIKGKTEKKQGKIEQSKASFEQSIETLNKAVIETRNSNGSKSVSITTETALNLVVAHKSLGQYGKALKWIDNSLAAKRNLRPFDHAKFLVNKGNIYFELGRKPNKNTKNYYKKAEASYRKALKVYPQNLKARINLASILEVLGRPKEAIKFYQQVLTINPSNAYVKKNLQRLKSKK